MAMCPTLWLNNGYRIYAPFILCPSELLQHRGVHIDGLAVRPPGVRRFLCFPAPVVGSSFLSRANLSMGIQYYPSKTEFQMIKVIIK